MGRCPPRHARLPSLHNLIWNCTTARETTGAARNAAVKQCRGEDYITFLDSDDLALPYAVERMLKLMDEHNATVGIHDYFPKPTVKVVRNHTELVPYFREQNPPFALDAHMAHSTVHRSVLVPFRNLTIGEDSWLMRDLWKRNATFVHTAEKLTVYIDRNIYGRQRRRAPTYTPNQHDRNDRNDRHRHTHYSKKSWFERIKHRFGHMFG